MIANRQEIKEKNRLELKAITDEAKSVREELHVLSSPLRVRLAQLSGQAELIRTKIRASEERESGKRDDDERMRLKNERSRSTATLHYERWCEVDDSFIMENRGKMVLMDLAKNLGRTRKSVKSRIYALTRNNETAI